MQDILTHAVELDRRKHFLDGGDADFAELKAHPKEWEAYLAERDAWDSVLQDGLNE